MSAENKVLDFYGCFGNTSTEFSVTIADPIEHSPA
ncbi:hypothetical protein PASE110613_15250 [Paenibacillus sediminis]|uniref:Uncharacterized protein n=1 Tax=Paenibacillus sediminis TaxID=664909 RepID=A0ABS4H465_9BACL|nr:hypothetical protein [Paenibacillus sediminis]